METLGLESLLLAGLDLVGLAKSSKAAGFKVYAVDYFGDYDLVEACDGYQSIMMQKPGKSSGKIEEYFRSEKFVDLTKKVLREASVDALLLSSGLDDAFDTLEELNNLVPILGNKPSTFRKVRSKPEFFGELKHLNLFFPETVVVESLKDAYSAAKDVGYPVIVKPSSGFAGIAVRKAKNPEELKECFRTASSIDSNVIIQEFVDGVHASISFVSSTSQVKVLTVNEQLLGLEDVGQTEPFGFSGNIVPLDVSRDIFNKCLEIVEKIAFHFGLLGSNGIDIVLSREGDPYIIEVNPRFQATLECVERVLGLNLVEMHVAACLNNDLPPVPKLADKCCVRLILFSKDRVKVKNLIGLDWVRDIPFPEVIIEKGEPLCSVIVEGTDKKLCLKESLEKAKFVYERLVELV